MPKNRTVTFTESQFECLVSALALALNEISYMSTDDECTIEDRDALELEWQELNDLLIHIDGGV